MKRGILWLFALLLSLSYDEKSEQDVIGNSTDEEIISMSKKKLVLEKAKFSFSLFSSFSFIS